MVAILRWRLEAAATEALLLEDCMARMRRRRPHKTGVKKIAHRRSTATKSAANKRPSRAGSKRVSANSRRARRRAVKVAAKRALVSAGRAAKTLAKVGAERAAQAGRKVIARGVRSAATGLQQAAQSAGDVTASALESIAERVEPKGT